MDENDLYMRLSRLETVEDLAACLQELRHSAGGWPLKRIEKWGAERGKELATSTVSDVLRAKRPPQQRLLMDLLKAFGVTDPAHLSVWVQALERVTRDSSATPQSTSAQAVGQVPAAMFFDRRDDLFDISKQIKSAQSEVWLWGATLTMHLDYLVKYFGAAAVRDVSIKVLLITRQGRAMDMNAFRMSGQLRPADVSHLQAGLDYHLGLLARVAGSHPNLEVRQVDYLAPYTLYAYDPGLPSGRMDLRLGSFLGDHDMRPTFRLAREGDGEWFDYFCEQFVRVWDVAEPYRGADSG
ncbi:hypothetical protein ACIRO3_29545 [Streptomyces sp. NPDC102278]|uniref:hypothetical protein n=1 Tax=Streptomyces sp. NPDC102278 TaxID=3366152 RepID=UPI003830242C